MVHRTLIHRLAPNYTPQQEECYTCGELVLRVKARGPDGVVWVFRNVLSGTDHRCDPQPFTEALRRVCTPRIAPHGQATDTQVS